MPGGRPVYQPTETDRATVQNMVVLGAPEATIARCIGVGRKGISVNTLKRHFRRELDTAAWELKTFATSKVVQAMKAGDMATVRWFLERKAGFAEARRFVDEEGRDRGTLTLKDVDDAIEAAEAAAKAEQERNRSVSQS
jgi:hypothetical protein